MSEYVEIDAHFFVNAQASNVRADFVLKAVVQFVSAHNARKECLQLHCQRRVVIGNSGLVCMHVGGIAAECDNQVVINVGFNNAVVIDRFDGVRRFQSVAVDADVAYRAVIKVESDIYGVGHGAETRIDVDYGAVDV